jgi:uncharacterized PurR-regulated membrane protein YhhQ (DUF165 family)
MLPVTFLAIDVLRRLAEGKTLKRAIVWVDLWVLLATGSFVAAGMAFPRFRQSEMAFYAFVAMVLLLSAWSFWARKDRLGLELRHA